MKSLLNFDALVTPKFITVIYWIIIALIIFSGLSSVIMAMYFGSMSMFFTSLIATVGGLVFNRIWCEVIVVLFKINSNLQKVADATEKPNL